MQRLGFTVLRNAISNVIRGGASAIVALAMPHFLVHTLLPARFAAWALILQIAAYASYLDFGLQLAVSRFLAQAIELGQRDRREQLIRTAFTMLCIAGAIALAVIGFVAAMAPRFFRGIPPGLIHEVRMAALILGASAAALLPASIFTGILVGLHRNDVPAFVIGFTRLTGAAVAILVSRHTESLMALASCIAAANLLGGLLQWMLAGRLLRGSNRLRLGMDSAMATELLHYCTGLTVFSLGMFLVSGLDITILGHFDFSAVGYYAIANLLVVFVAGLNNSLLAALMTPIAALQAQGAVGRIRKIVLMSTRAHVGANLLGTSVLFCFGQFLLRIWVGESYATLAYPIMQVLMLAQLLRLIPSAYCTMLIATGQQRNAIGNAAVEAVVNLTASIFGAMYWGAEGVAYGTLAGSVAGVIWVALRTVRKDQLVMISTSAWIAAVVRSFLCSAPFWIAWLATRTMQNPSVLRDVINTSGIVSTTILLLLYGELIPQNFQEKFRQKFGKFSLGHG